MSETTIKTVGIPQTLTDEFRSLNRKHVLGRRPLATKLLGVMIDAVAAGESAKSFYARAARRLETTDSDVKTMTTAADLLERFPDLDGATKAGKPIATDNELYLGASILRSAEDTDESRAATQALFLAVLKRVRSGEAWASAKAAEGFAPRQARKPKDKPKDKPSDKSDGPDTTPRDVPATDTTRLQSIIILVQACEHPGDVLVKLLEAMPESLRDGVIERALGVADEATV